MNSTRLVWLVVSWCMSLLAAMAQQDTNPDTTVTSTPAISLSGIPSSHRFDARDIRSFPVRGMDQLLSLVPGVVYQNGELHFRGGRAGEVRYYLDGHAITNAFTSRSMFEPIPEALEGINVSAGVSNARFGRALSGQVMSTMKTGGQQLEIFGDLRTDEFVGTGKEFLGTTSFGHRDAILTLGGPLPGLDQTRFFLAGRHLFLRNRQPRFVTPFSIDLQAYQYSEPFPGPLVIDQTTFANNTEEQNVVQGNIVHEDGPLRIQLTGHYGSGSHTLGSEWPSRIQRFYNQRRNSELKTTSAFLGLTGRYAFTPSTSLEVRASYGMNSTRTVDPDFGETWTLYADSAANAAIGYKDFDSRWYFRQGYETEYWLRFDRTGIFNDSYSRQSQSFWTGALEVKHALTDRMFLTFAVDIERWTMREFSIGDISNLMFFYDRIYSGPLPKTYASPEVRRWLAARVGNVDAYGYDVDGNAVDEGPDAPYHPLFVSASASHTWHLAGFVFETGLRYESFNMGIGMFRDHRDPHLVVYDGNAEVIPQENIVDSKTYGLLLPRIRAQYSAQNGAEISITAGCYAQMPSLDRILHSFPSMVWPLVHDHAFSRPIGLMVQPERCELFEAALRQPLGKYAWLEVVAYLKDAWRLITIRRIRDAGFWDYTYYANEDETRMKGLELSLGLDNGGGLRARLAYALSEVQGTGTYPGSSIGYVDDYPARLPPVELYLLDHNQTHRGTILLSARPS
ncbi:MAG: TonB-dependent receptor plug domain-containing protein, partial [Bacteroidetes bacterium]|nr:TonB-dependent receptor plug domain-containing protein [Bacteroidota bacterium]